jgi:hypothetical protein
MIGVARQCSPFTLGLDSLAPCPSKETAAAFRADGYRYWGRYLDAGENSLTEAERDRLFASDMAILPLTVAPADKLSASFGSLRAAAIARQLAILGCPPGVHVVLDLEAVNPASSPIDVMTYVNAFDAMLIRGGHPTLLYVGADQPLTAAQLYTLDPSRYMRSISLVPEPACGWCILQLTPGNQTRHGVRIDMSIVQADYRGRLPTFWWPK